MAGPRSSLGGRTHARPKLWSALTAAAVAVPLALVALSAPEARAGETSDDATLIITLPRPIVAVYAHSTAVVPAERVQGGSAGGPGSAAANAAVSDACAGGAELQDPQWYALLGINVGQLQIVQRGIRRDDVDPLPANFAIVNADTLDVISCEPGPVAVPDDTPLLVVGYYDTSVPQCDVAAEQSCAQAHVDWVIHQVSAGPPANDDWQDAVQINSLPFVGLVNMQRATQDGPLRADWSQCYPDAVNLVETADAWYEYTPTVSGPISVAVESPYLGYTPFFGVTRLTGSGPAPPDPTAQFEECFNPPILLAGQTYLIYVQSRFDSFYGEARPVGGPTNIVIGVENPILPPRAVFAVLGPDPLSARVVWLPGRGSDAAGVTGYRVTRDGPGGFSVDIPNGQYSYVFEDLQPWTRYNVTVRPMVGSTLGLPGATIVFLSADTPSAPRNVTAEPARHEVTLSWTKPAYPGDSPVTGYRIRRYIAASGTLVQTVTVPASRTTRVFPSLLDGRAYDFDVTAINASGTGAVAALPGTVTPAGPASAPQFVSVSRDEIGKTATLNWSPPGDNGGTPVTGYQVTRTGVDTAGNGPLTLMLGATARSVVLERLVPGTRYLLTVAAITSAGVGEDAPIGVTLTTPSVPRDVEAEAGDGTVTLTWSRPRWAGSEPLSAYRIRRFNGATNIQAQNFEVPAGTTSYTFTGLTNGSTYSFDVTAINPTGKGPASPRTPVVTVGP